MLPRFQPNFPWSVAAKSLVSSAGSLVEIEAAFLREFPYEHAIWFPSARQAVRAFLVATGNPRTQTCLSVFNCTALLQSVVSAGMHPRFVDVEPNGFNADVDQFVKAMQGGAVENGIWVSLWGIPPSELPISEITKPILYDYALRGLDNSPVALRAIDAAVYSFNYGKPLTMLNGGMLATNDSGMASRLFAVRNQLRRHYSRVREAAQALFIKAVYSRWLFSIAEEIVGYTNERGNRELEVLDGRLELPSRAMVRVAEQQFAGRSEILAVRRAEVERYQTQLQSLDVNLPPSVPWLSHFPLRTEHRDRLFEFLKQADIFSSRYLFRYLLCEYHCADYRPESPHRYPRAAELARTTLHLPLFHRMSTADQERVINRVREFFANLSSPDVPTVEFRRASMDK